MAASAESAIELTSAPSRATLVNIEINNTCRFTKVCSDSCILNQVSPGAPSMSNELRLGAMEELCRVGNTVQHVALAGKEPFDTPDHLQEILKVFHQSSEENRPAQIGVITSGTSLREHASWLAELPLSWCAVSIDTPHTGLRLLSENTADEVLDAALQLKRGGGAGAIGVNSVCTNTNTSALLELGEKIFRTDVDQWAISPLLQPQGRQMKSSMTTQSIEALIQKVADQLTGSRVVFELTMDTLRELLGVSPVLRADVWRVEVPITSHVSVMAGRTEPGYFFRLRHDGQLLAKSDFHTLGLQEGSYGRYHRGRIEGLLGDFASQRNGRLAA